MAPEYVLLTNPGVSDKLTFCSKLLLDVIAACPL